MRLIRNRPAHPQRHQPTPTSIAPRRSAQPCPTAAPPPRGSTIRILVTFTKVPVRNAG